MCEILVRVVDKRGPTPVSRDARLSKAGDVITVQANGWNWGRMELANPEWRIWIMPTLTVESMKDLEQVEETRIAGQAFFARFRAMYLDLSSPEARALIARGQQLLLDEADTRRVVSWKRWKQTLGTVG